MLRWRKKRTVYNIPLPRRRKRQKNSLNPSQDLNLRIDNLNHPGKYCKDYQNGGFKWFSG